MPNIQKELMEELGESGLLERVSLAKSQEAISQIDKLVLLIGQRDQPRCPYLGDDFIPDTISYNALGAVYSLLSRDSKNKVLKAFLSKLDIVNSYYVIFNHTSYIREPLLLADISITRRQYWPGLERAENLISKYPNFSDFEKDMLTQDGLFNPQKVDSDFIVAYATLRNDTSHFGSEYARASNISFLDRTIEGIVALRFGGLSNDEEHIKSRHSRLIELLPKEVHHLVEKKYEEKRWANPLDFM